MVIGADLYAKAIVAAARETGDDPLAIAERSAIQDRSSSPGRPAPREAPKRPAPTKPIPDAKAAHGPLRTRLDQFAAGFGKPRSDLAGGDDQVEARIREQRQCRDLLATAAANTAKLQAKLPPEPDE